MFGRGKDKSDDKDTVAKVDGSNSPPSAEPVFEVSTSRGFSEWLSLQNISLAVTTYQVGKIIFFGVDESKKLWVFNRNVGRCLGLQIDESGFWVSGDTQLFRYENLIQAGTRTNGPDSLFAPRLSYFTGDLDIHDIGLGKNGVPVFVNTLFNCLAAPSDKHSFTPIWKPKFISRLVAEDRCHLNGLAMHEGQARFVTAVATTDVFDGWREHRESGGVLIDVGSGEIAAQGMSMPHSPRLYQNQLWLHNSGTGEFGKVDLDSGTFEPVCFCPGYLRGLDFFGNVAVVGLSLPRNKTFSGLKIEERLQKEKVGARCGLLFIDLNTGTILHSMTFDGVVSELYDVGVIAGRKQPSAYGPNAPELARTLSVPDFKTETSQ